MSSKTKYKEKSEGLLVILKIIKSLLVSLIITFVGVIAFAFVIKYFNLGDDIFDATTVMICLKLNDEAKEKVKTYIMDLSLIDKYRREEHTVRNPKETSHKTYEAENLPGKRFSHDDTNTHIQEI